MKNLITILTLLLFPFYGNSITQNKLTIPTIEGGLAKEVTIPISLENDMDIVAAQFKINFPEGCSVNTTSAALSNRKVDHTLSVKSLGGNDYLFVIFSATNKPIKFNSGVLLHLNVSIPQTWTLDSVYAMSFKQVILSASDGRNLASTSDAGAIRVTNDPSPDIMVQNITCTNTNWKPGQKLNIEWQVRNIGNKATQGFWNEQIIAVDANGNEAILGNASAKDNLLAGATLNRQTEVVIPNYPGIDGTASLKIKLLPAQDLGELLSAVGNNTATSVSTFQLSKNLNLKISENSTLETIETPINCFLYRSGSRLIDETFSLSCNQDNRITFPVTLTIKAGESGVFFTIQSTDNAVLDADSICILFAKSGDYAEVADTLIIFDNELPTLKISISKAILEEGETATLQVERPMANSKSLTVKLNSNLPKRLNLPTELLIPANQKSASFNLKSLDDNLPALTVDASIIASAIGYFPDTAIVVLTDNDMPQLALTFSPATVTESAGAQATIVTIKRTGIINNAITVKITDNASGALFYSNNTFSFAVGETEKQIALGVVDNQIVDGAREYTINAVVYMASCGCSSSSPGIGLASAKLTILDDDGPALKITSTETMLPEGRTQATMLTVSRNTATAEALTVVVSSNKESMLTYQHSATIPAGSVSVTIPIAVKSNSTSEGNQIVTFTASANGFTNGVCWAMITDQTLADATVAINSLSTNNPLTKDTIKAEIRVNNTGVATLAAGTEVNIYICNSTVLSSASNKQLLSSIYTTKPINSTEFITLTASIILPDLTGQFYLIAVVNESQTIKELSYLNNTSTAQSIQLLPTYTVNVLSDKKIYNQGQAIILSGNAVNQGNSSVNGVSVEVYVINNGYRQSLKATTDVNGAFSIKHTPYSGQMGHFSVGACYPGQSLSDEQTSFDIYGLKRTSNDNIIWDVLADEQNTGEIEISNPSNLSLTGLKTTITSNPATGVQLTFDALSNLAANGTVKLKYTVTGTTVSTGTQYNQIKFQVTTNEGAILDITSYYYCRSVKATLKANMPSIQTTMTKGETRTYPITITNTGKGSSGKISIVLPTESWLSLASPFEIPSLDYGQSSTVVLQLTPTANMEAHTFVTGTIGVNCENGNGFPLTFNIETVSEKTGSLAIDVCNEYTYYTSAAPHLSGAKVVVKHPYTGQVYAQGTTDSNGLFIVDNLAEGYYTVVVTADKHDSYQNNILVDPGKTTKTIVNLSFQAITYTWNVVETEVEDEYKIETEVKYETNVPVPVVEMSVPSKIETDNLQLGESLIFNAILTNKGLISAKDVLIIMPEGFKLLKFEPIIPDGFSIKPQESVIFPIKVTRIDNNNNSKTGMFKSTSITTNDDMDDDPCAAYPGTLYFWDCGLDRQWHRYEVALQVGSCHDGKAPKDLEPKNPMNEEELMEYLKKREELNYIIAQLPTYNFNVNSSSSTPVTTIDKGCEPCQNSFLWKMGKCFVKRIPIVEKVLKIVETVDNVIENVKCGYDIIVNRDLNCLIKKYFPEKDSLWILEVVGQKELYLECIKPLFEKCNPGDFGFKVKAKTDKTSLSSSMPSFISHFQEVLKNTYIVANSLEDQTFEIFGDSTWLRITKGELNQFWTILMRYDGTIAFNDEELNKNKPSIITNEIYHKFIERWNNTIIYRRDNQNYIDFEKIEYIQDQVKLAEDFAFNLGYASILEMFDKEYEIYQKKADEGQNSVCSSISLQFSQTMTMTRQAFRGTLTLYNGHETAAMQNVKLNLEIKDSEGNLAGSQLFQVNTESVDKLTAIDGTGALEAQQTGTATILFIPSKYAAPSVSKIYTFGGTLSYLDPFTNTTVTRDLYPATLTVKPSPDLTLDYFMQRDVLGDDPLTAAVESVVPTEFSLLIHNKGAGDATNVVLDSEQPKIIENEKGLNIEFKMFGSSLNGTPTSIGFSRVDFGTVSAGKSSYGQWWFTSSLLGHFTEYKAELTHITSFDNPDLSLISEVKIHELIRSIEAKTATNETLTAFMTNDIPDDNDQPDMLYLADGTTEPAFADASANMVKTSDNVYTLSITPSMAGYNYGNITDPTDGRAKLVSIIRTSDNATMSLRNFWQTDRTLLDKKEPVYEYKLHFVDKIVNETETYLLSFDSKPDNVLSVKSLSGIPENVSRTSVTKVSTLFNKAIDNSTFTSDDIIVTYQGKSIDVSKIVISQVSDIEYMLDLSQLAEITSNGYFVITIQTKNIKDIEGYQGETGKMAGWKQYLDDNIQLVLKVVPENSGKVTPSSGEFTYGKTVTIHATPEYGYKFKKWMLDGENISTESTISYVPVESKTLVANFDPKIYSVTINNDPSKGLIIGYSNNIYSYMSILNIEAIPNEGYEFENWKVNDVPVETKEILTIDVTEDLIIEPVFKLKIITDNNQINNRNEISMNVFPNPSTNGAGVYVSIDIPNEELKHSRLLITSLLGSVVKEIDLISNKTHVEDIGKGMFIFNLHVNGTSVEHRKVVIQ